MRADLPVALRDNPLLDQWVTFLPDGQVGVRTGKVEIGQGVLTAMLQIAAEELEVSPRRIVLQSGATGATPNEGYTSGSQSIQFGGVALRLACAEIRARFLERAAAVLGGDAGSLRVADGAILRHGAPTGQDYWTLAASVDLHDPATGDVPPKPMAAYGIVGRPMPRTDLAAKVFGAPVFMHDLTMDGMLHARVIRQPGRHARLAGIDPEGLRRGLQGAIELVRHGDFLAVVGPDETAVEAAGARASAHVTWDGAEATNPTQQEASWLLQRPSIDRVLGSDPAPVPAGARVVEATYTRPFVAHASIAPSCGVALFAAGQLQVWTHSQGVYPLRAALARMLGLDAAAITVTHVQGPGCYGHNGADDAAADAAIIATRLPGRPIRVRWRREEEFRYEPVSPSMVVKTRAVLDAAGKPQDWTAEIWSSTHSTRPAGDGGLLQESAMPTDLASRPPGDVPETGGGGGTRNADPLYDFPARRIIHHLIPEPPVRTSALRGLGATANVFALESFMDELAGQAGTDPVAYRLGMLSDPRARQVVERVAAMCGWQAGAPAGTGQAHGIGFARYKNRAAYAAVVAEVAVDEEIRVLRVWCAVDAGQVINPDGAINQAEGGILQAISWVLKEQVRVDYEGIGSRDWDAYPVLRFTDVPEVTVELVNPATDLPPLGVGEVTGGPTAAAIGNAAARALGARLRDLPLTRERVMAALLGG